MQTKRSRVLGFVTVMLISCAYGGCGTQADAGGQALGAANRSFDPDAGGQALGAANRSCDPDLLAADTEADVSACRCSGRMFWSEGNMLRSAGLDGTGVTTVATGMFPMGVAVDAKGGKVYWADNGTDTIYRANFDGSAIEVLYGSGDRYANPAELALDVQHGRMYWTESHAVRSASLDGTGVATVLAAIPTGVALASGTRPLYWSDNGSDTIQRAAYDGTGAELLYQNADPFSNPTGVKLEVHSDRIFWVEGAVVRSARSDGTAVRTVANGVFPTDVALDPVTRKVYWTDNGSDTVNRADYDGSRAEQLYQSADLFANPRGVAVVTQRCARTAP